MSRRAAKGRVLKLGESPQRPRERPGPVWPEPSLPAIAKERNKVRNALVLLALSTIVAQLVSCWNR